MSKKSTLEQIHRSWFSDLIKETYYYCHHSLCVEILIFFTANTQKHDRRHPIIAFFLAFSCMLTFIFSLYINLKGVSKQNPHKN
jgi:hypothetical protein